MAALRFLTNWSCIVWLMAMVMVALALPIADQLLWGEAALPSFDNAYRKPAVWLAGIGTVLKVTAVIPVNGLLAPWLT